MGNTACNKGVFNMQAILAATVNNAIATGTSFNSSGYIVSITNYLNASAPAFLQQTKSGTGIFGIGTGTTIAFMGTATASPTGTAQYGKQFLCAVLLLPSGKYRLLLAGAPTARLYGPNYLAFASLFAGATLKLPAVTGGVYRISYAATTAGLAGIISATRCRPATKARLLAAIGQ